MWYTATRYYVVYSNQILCGIQQPDFKNKKFEALHMDSEKLFLRLVNSSKPATNITYIQSFGLLTLLPSCRAGGCQENIYSINVYSNLMFRGHIIKCTTGANVKDRQAMYAHM